MNKLSIQIHRGIARLANDRGASMVEYALLIVLIAMIAVVALTFAGSELSTTYTNIADSVGNPP